MFGVINIYKPKGLTSHDVVGIIRKILKIKQVGHTGTLDPFAEGVLPICIGKATRLIDYFDDGKEYLATVQFGSATDTYDLEGNITKTSDKKATETEIKSALLKFKGEISQTPPMYSAIKINGKKLYEYAREGKTVQIEPRKITIYNIELKNFNENNQTADILVKCSKGTYIRSLANDLGENIGCFGHLTRLIRTQAGKFTLDTATELPVTLDEKSSQEHSNKYSIQNGAENIILKSIKNPTEAMSLPIIEICTGEYHRVSNGNSIKTSDKKINSGDFLILVYNNHVVAVGQCEKDEIKVKKVLI